MVNASVYNISAWIIPQGGMFGKREDGVFPCPWKIVAFSDKIEYDIEKSKGRKKNV